MLRISLLLIFPIILLGCQAPRPEHLGLMQKGEKVVLSPCPEKPNCINSHFPEDEDHYMKPLNFPGKKEDAKALLLKIIQNTPNTQIIKESEDYIHAEYTSSLFKFIDDVELHFEGDNTIHFKSASRSGYSDLGVNRKRMSELSFRFYQNDQ